VAYTVIYGALVAVADAPDMYVAGYAIIVFFLYVFLPVGFVAASVAGWLCTIGFSLAMMLTRPLPLDVMAIVGVQFLSANAVGMFALYWMDRFRRQDFLNLDRIDAERRRHHRLLTRVLPATIADRLSGGEAQIADTVEAATVLFADVVDFTGMTANCPSRSVVAFLDALFADFDRLAATHGVEKIKTIGDSYMAAAGLTDQAPDHAERVGRMALDMITVAERIRPDGKPLQIRIGMHSGPVVAGVIGDKRFLYDVWGETVNLAQRLEAHGEAGRIQVSEAFRAANADAFTYSRRGSVDLKGTGPTDVWYLTGLATMP
jgi:adenylate cyclase